MAYTKYSLTAADNNSAPPNGAPEGMLPSAVNDTMRDMMAQIRDVGDGIRDGTYTMTAAKITGGTITGVALTGNTFTSPIISGGSINNTPIGATTASTGAFSTLSVSGATAFSGATTFSGATVFSASVNANTFSSSNATITGGSITGITDLAVADGGTGSSTLAANAVLLGNGTSALQTVAPSTTGNVLTSNGTIWASASPTSIGVGQTWQDVTASRASGTTYTNSTGKPIQISIVIISTGTNQGNLVINGVTAVSAIVGATGATHQYSFIIPDTNTYVLTLSGGSVNRWLELR
jgi:hypothetical protein